MPNWNGNTEHDYERGEIYNETKEEVIDMSQEQWEDHVRAAREKARSITSDPLAQANIATMELILNSIMGRPNEEQKAHFNGFDASGATPIKARDQDASK